MNFRTLVSILLFLILCFFANKWALSHYCCGAENAVVTNDAGDSSSEISTNTNTVTTDSLDAITTDSGNEVSENQIDGNVNSEVSATNSETALNDDNLNSEPLSFNWNSKEATTGAGWEAQREALIGQKGDGKKLKIVGGYYPNEVNNTGYGNLGIARAHEVKKLLLNRVPDADISITSKEMTGTANRDKPMSSVIDWNWYSPSANRSVEIMDGEVNFRFGYKSAEKMSDQEIINYLKGLVTQLKANDKTVHLVGHTDNVGGAPGNKLLGQQRANAIRDLLIEYGLESNRIIASSEGEMSPIATNETEEGREKNRRVNLKLK